MSQKTNKSPQFHHRDLPIMLRVTMLGLISLAFRAEANIPEMVSIPAGSFMMGSCINSSEVDPNKKNLPSELINNSCGAIDQQGVSNETPKHKVDIKAFKLSKTEVTVKQFRSFIVDAARNDILKSRHFEEMNSKGDNKPVILVSWQDANDYISWLNLKHGNGFRLPSEAEWEYACLAGKDTKYCGSDDINEVAWYENNNDGQIKDVAQKKPNAFGLYDMSGNALEWTADCYNENYKGAPVDGSPWQKGDCDLHVVRGGRSANSARISRAVTRFGYPSQHRLLSDGFRIAQDM